MNLKVSDLIVITGGPGSGKTTLIEALRKTGIRTSPEAGRAIIRQQRAIGGPGVPEHDPLLYAELMLGWELRSYEAASQSGGPVYFDRGIPDILGYLHLLDRPAPAHISEAANRFRYKRQVFIAPHWPDIFTGDAERSDSLQIAELTFRSMLTIYRALGYTLCALPFAPVEERVRFILEKSAT